MDGNEYVDFMCSFGPVLLGHRHPKVEAAVVDAEFARQLRALCDRSGAD